MRKTLVVLLLVLMVLGISGVAFAKTPEVPNQTAQYQWISPNETYITSNYVVPVSIQIGRKADIRIEIYKMTQTPMVPLNQGMNVSEEDELVAFTESGDLLGRILNVQTEKVVKIDQQGNKEESKEENSLELLTIGETEKEEVISVYTFQSSLEELKSGALGIFNYEVNLSSPGEYILYVYVKEATGTYTTLERKVKVVDPEQAKKYIDVYRKVMQFKNQLGIEVQ